MFTTALVLAIVVLTGFIILFKKLPPWLQNFLSKRYLLLDILVAFVAFWALGYAMIGMLAAGFICLFVSGYLYLKREENKRKERN